MKKLLTPIAALLLAAGLLAGAATNDLSGLLQKGLFEEEANRNLDAAITAYQSLVKAFDQDRRLAATAVFRLGECYRKLGQTNEAIASYERILRDFADETTLANLSRQNLAGLGLAPAVPTVTASAPLSRAARQEQARLLAEQIKLAELDMAEASKQFQAGIVPQADVRAKQREVLQLKRELAALDATPTAPSAESSAATAVLIDDEETEIRRLQAMIQNSPDLINAPAGEDKLTPLCRAAGKGQLRVAEFLLKSGADVNLNRPLHSAASAGHKAMVELLLSRGANVNAAGLNNQTPLHQAANQGFLSVTEALLAAKADPNLRDNSNQTPLNLAAKNGFRPVAAALLAKGADPNVASKTQPNYGQNPIEQGRAMFGTPLHLAAARGDAALVSLLLTNRADVTAQSIYGETPLQVAAARGKADVVTLLLDAGADPNARNNTEAASPLHLAASAGHVEVVKALLERGANPNLTAQAGLQGVTPLMHAAGAGHDETVRLLLAHQADPNRRDGQGNTALIQAINAGQTAAVKSLLAGGADPNLSTANGFAPLVLAIGNRGNKDMAAALLEAKADTEAVSPDGKTPLHYAVEGGDSEMVALLLKSGASANAANANGSTPLHLAVAYKRSDLAELLLAAKADPNLRNQDGLTPLDLAAGKSAPARLPGPGVPMPIPSRPLQPGSALTPSPATAAALADLLRQHGAVDDLPKLDRIEVRRPGGSFTRAVFMKGTNDWNRFTLLDAVLNVLQPSGTQFQPGPTPPTAGMTFQERLAALMVLAGPSTVALPFPDLRRLTIVRPGATPAAPPQRLTVNLLNARGEVDCAKDVPLQFGDVVEIPEREHTLQEAVVGLTGDEARQMAECRKGTVNLMVRGKATPLTVWPVPSEAQVGAVLARPEARAALFSSSDLSRVKVVRKADPAGEWVLDCSGSASPDLWLRDGDVIEVPEK